MKIKHWSGCGMITAKKIKEQKEYESYGHDGKARITMKYRADGKRADICW